MSNKNKARDEQAEELAALRARLSELERVEVERKRAEEALRYHNLVLEVLSELSREVASTLEVSPMLDTIARVAAQAIGVTSAYVCDWDSDEGTITVLAEYLGPMASEKERVSDLGVTYNILEAFGDSYPADWVNAPEGFYVLQADDPAVTPEEKAHLEMYDGKSVLRVLIRAQDKLLGYIELWESRLRRDFPDEEIELVRAIANQVAISIEHAQLHEALMKSEQRYRRIVKEASDVVYVTDHLGRFTYVNAPAERLTSYALDDLIGKPFTEIIPPEWREAVLGFYQRQFREKQRETQFEFPVITRTGEQKWVEQVATLLIEGERVVGFQGIVRDITERRQAEMALQESEALRRGLFDSVPLGLYRTTPEGHILDANPAFVEMLGYPDRESILERNAVDLYMDPGEREKWRAIADREGVVQNFETRFRRQDGAVIWVKLDVRVTRDAGGQVLYYEGSLEDITGRKRIEEAECEQRVLAEALWDIATALNSTLNLEEVLDRILSNIERIVPHDMATVMILEGDTARIVRQRGYERFGLEEHVCALRFPISETKTLRTMIETQKPLLIPDIREYPAWVDAGTNEWIRAYLGVPIRLRGGVIGFFSLDCTTPSAFTDEDAGRLQAFADQAAIAIGNARLFETVRSTAEALEARTGELAEFGATVAHDLKSPLQILLGFANLLTTDYAGEVNEEVLDILRTIESNALRMNQIIESLLLLATVGSAEQVVSEVLIGPIIEAALTRSSALLQERGIAVTVEIPPDLPPVIGHGPWLEEVFANLMENAAKYIGAGNPAPRVLIRGSAGDRHVRFEVEDNGMGIAPESRSELFKPGTRFHSKQAKGHGLGLSIVWRIIHKLKGEVGVESTPGQGSTFWFTLPAAQ
jgi:PAS domain S-box-containing protein